MPTRKRKNPELTQAVDSMRDATQHVRNAVQRKIDEARDAAAAEIAKAKASALRKTGAAQQKVESLLNKTEGRLHKMIDKAQKALDKAVREAERCSAAGEPMAAAKKSTGGKVGPAKPSRVSKIAR